MTSNNPFAGQSKAPSTTGAGGSPPGAGPSSTTVRRPPVVKKLSIFPTVVALILVLVSVVLAVFVLLGLNSDQPLPWAVLGYLLTPFGTAGCLIWARYLDLKGQSDPGYLKADGQRRLRTLGLIALVSFIPAIAFIWYLASYVGSVVA